MGEFWPHHWAGAVAALWVEFKQRVSCCNKSKTRKDRAIRDVAAEESDAYLCHDTKMSHHNSDIDCSIDLLEH